MIRVARFCAALAAVQMLVTIPATVQAQSTSDLVQVATVVTAQQVEMRSPKATTDTANSANSAAVRSASPLAGPAANAVGLRMRHVDTENAAVVPQTSRANASAMMVVGLAAVVAGIAVGDDAGTILVLAGSGIGLYGLYKFMQY